MENISLSGSYFDVGYNNGMALAKMGFVPRAANSVEIRFAKDSVPEIRRNFPEILEEIEGLGMALRGNYKDILASVLTGHVVFEDHSAVFAAGKDVTSGKRILLARNYNCKGSDSRSNLRLKTSVKGNYAHIGNTDIPVGRQDGMNAKGLAIAGSSVHGGNIKPGIVFTLLIRQALDKCSNVDEAMKLLSSVKHARPFNFVLADSSGKIALVEASPESTNSKVMDRGIMVATNHFQTRGASTRPHDTVSRHKRISSLINSTDNLNLDAAMKILSDHKEKVCEHHESSEFGTQWSAVFSTKEGIVTASDGNPCTSKRKEYKI